MKIRIATKDDAPGVAKVHIDTWKACYKGIVPDDYLASFNYEARTKGWEEGLSDSSQLNFIAEDEGEVIAWVTFGVNRDKRAENIFEIYGLYVLPEHWGSGVGLSLFNAAVFALEREKLSAITLWVLEENARAISFYKTNGFQLDGGTEKIEIGGVELTELRFEKQYSKKS